MADGQHARYSLRATSRSFSAVALGSGVPRPGCVLRGASRDFVLSTPSSQPQLTSLGDAQVSPYYLAGSDNHVTALTVRRGAPPTSSLYDVEARHPDLRLSLSACNASAAQQWHLRVSVASDAAASEVFFEVIASLEDASLSLGEASSGVACCGQYKYYVFPAVSESVAPAVDFNLTSGAIKALYWKYDSCPVEADDVILSTSSSGASTCRGWCVLSWYRLFSTNLGNPQYLQRGQLRVPYGAGEAPDKRRGGRWYLGIQPLDSLAEYSFQTTAEGPQAQPRVGCTRLQRYCPAIFNQLASYVTSSAPPVVSLSTHALSRMLAAASTAWLLRRTLRSPRTRRPQGDHLSR
uniref:Uncharacterized protein n=1 Tax=Haptolina ericina TaxID=156174 RepID=A0A7S3BHP5_9EUKA